MSSHEYKSALRKQEPHIAARDCLLKIESLIFNTARGKQEMAMSLISEFIFCEHAQHPPPSLQEFQLVLVLCDYFSKSSLPEQTKNATFLLLFGGTTISATRINVLIKLTSTAISAQLSSVLNCVGTLIQQVGFSSVSTIELAQSLVQDFVIFSSKTSQQLNELPKIAPRFASNFMTAATTLYLNETNQVSLQEPPDLLLEIFTNWITDNPSLCLASQQPLVLPAGMLSMPSCTPLAGLIRWSCVSALISQKEIYSKLHLSLLQSLLQAKPVSGPPVALNAQHLLIIVTIVQYRLEDMGATAEKSEAVQNCLERFAQCIQIALASKCVYGNIPQLLMRLETLKPTNQLMQIIVHTNK